MPLISRYLMSERLTGRCSEVQVAMPRHISSQSQLMLKLRTFLPTATDAGMPNVSSAISFQWVITSSVDTPIRIDVMELRR